MTKKIEEKKKSKGEKKYKYRTDGSGYDIGKMAPEAAPGEYIASVKTVEMQPTKEEQYPRLVIRWQLTEAVTDSDECKKSEKAFVFDRVTFYPESVGAKGNRQKRQLRQLCTHLDIDQDIVPTLKDGANDEDFEELIEAIKEAGQEVTIWVTHSPDKDDKTKMWENVQYIAPRGTAAKAKDEDPDDDEETDDDEEEEEEVPRKKKAAKDEDPDDDDEEDDTDPDDDDDEDEEDEPPPPKKKKKSRH